MAVLVSKAPDRPAFVFAASANLDPELALIKALEELAHTRRYSQQVKSKLPPVQQDDDWGDVTTQMDHLNFASTHLNKHLFSFMTASHVRRAFEDYENRSTGRAGEDVLEAGRRIELTGHRVLVAELTSSDIASVGLCVCRVLVPGYHPLFMGHSIRALGGKRLYEVPAKIGSDGINSGSQSNPAPHPYP